MSMDILSKYRSHFPSSEIGGLYEYQQEALNTLLAGENCLTIAPTGGGKSLIYQLIGLEFGKSVLVVSPLKALMQEQVNDLNKRGIPSITISSDLGFQEQRKVLRDLGKGSFRFIYVSPERLQNYFFKAAILHSKMKFALVVIDEAHCISQWGFDFRPEYGEIMRFIRFLKEDVGHRPLVFALTATLSPQAIQDIRVGFDITSTTVVNTQNLIRPELDLSFMQVLDKTAESDKWQHIVDFILRHHGRKVLIYFYSKKRSEEMSARLNEEKPFGDTRAEFFHADLTSEEKLARYSDFKEGKIHVLCATTAFGMGMNIRDIDVIIQYHLPKSIEEYYQQVGRGARDRSICPACYCLLFWSDKNIDANYREIRSEMYSEEKIRRGYEHFGFTGTIGQVTSISYSELKNSNINLTKLKLYFEELGVMETLGEINGGPKTIRFKNSTELWKRIQQTAVGNSFIIAAGKLDKSVQDLVNYVFDQDLKGNVDYLPAQDRKLFLRDIAGRIDDAVINQIIADSNKKIEYQLARFEELDKLCKCDDPVSYLRSVFGNLTQ